MIVPRSAVLAPFAAIALALAVVTCRDSQEPLSPRHAPLSSSFTPQPTASGPVTLVGAGNIAKCNVASDEQTANLLDGIPGTVFALGDNDLDGGTLTQYNNCYGPSWGRHKPRTAPTPGELDYKTSGAPGYFGYFGTAAGDPKKGYYSYDLGAWHVVVLNKIGRAHV